MNLGVVQLQECLFYTEKMVQNFIVEIEKIQTGLDSKHEEDLISTIGKVAANNRMEDLKAEIERDNRWRAEAAIHNPVTVLKPEKPLKTKAKILRG